MFDLFKTGIGIAAGVAGTLFIGYCWYLDHKRRKNSEYKIKCLKSKNHNCCIETNVEEYYFANLNDETDDNDDDDEEKSENYFLQELQLGEAYIACGNFESCVEHLANAISVCGQPTTLLEALYASLPSKVFGMLMIKLQEHGIHGQEMGTHSIRSADDVDYDEMDLAISSNIVEIDYPD